MKLDKTCQLFLGCKIDSKLREALANAKQGDRRYFEDPEFLCICVANREDKEERWIGKAVKGGINLAEIEDVQRNVLSILRRIASGIRISPSSLRMFVIMPVDAERPAVSTGQPYIEY